MSSEGGNMTGMTQGQTTDDGMMTMETTVKVIKIKENRKRNFNQFFQIVFLFLVLNIIFQIQTCLHA